MRLLAALTGLTIWLCLFETTHGRPPAEPLAEDCETTELDIHRQAGPSPPIYTLRSMDRGIVDVANKNPVNCTTPLTGIDGTNKKDDFLDISNATDPDVCSNGKSCYQSPENCAINDCIFLAGWDVEGDYVNFGISAKLTDTERYLAIAFSATGRMAPSPTVNCLHNTSIIDIKTARNIGYENHFLSPPTLGLRADSLTGNFLDGRLTCYFSYIKSKNVINGGGQLQNDTEFLADLTQNDYYLLLAKGKVSDQGNIMYHFTNRVQSATAVNFTASLVPETTTAKHTTETPGGLTTVINTKTCGLRKSCFRQPAQCDSSSCKYTITWTPRENYVDFEVEMPVTTQSYVAIGFALATNKMGPAPVVVCRYNPNNSTFSVISTENVETPRKANRILDPPTIGLEPSTSTAGYVDGRITCRFSYVKSASDVVSGYWSAGTDSIADFERFSYYLIMAKGPLGTYTTGIGYHTDRETSAISINFASATFINVGGVTQNQLIKVHGSLMIIAWMVCAGIGMLLPRYMKPAWPTTKVFNKHIWFVIHVSLVTTASLLTVTGFVVIFVHVQGFSTLEGLPHTSHPIIGIIVTCLAVINPILGLMRCDGDSPNRWVFNWAHRLVGQGAFCGAAANILTAMYMSQSGVADQSKWVVVGYMGLHVLTELGLLGLRYRPSCRRANTHGADQINDLEASAKQVTVRWPETVVIIVYAVCAVGLSLRLITRMTL